MLVFHAQVGHHDAGAVVARGAVQVHAAGLGVGEDGVGGAVQELDDRLGGKGFEGIRARVGQRTRHELQAGFFGGFLFQLDPGGFVFPAAGVFKGNDRANAFVVEALARSRAMS